MKKSIFLEDVSYKYKESELLTETKKAKSGYALYRTWGTFLNQCVKENINLGAVRKLLIISAKSATDKDCNKILNSINHLKETKALDIDFKKYSDKNPKFKNQLSSLKSWYFNGYKNLVEKELKGKSNLKEDFDWASVNDLTTNLVNDLIL